MTKYIVLLLLLALPALAHDDHDWMRADGYRNSRDEHCCSPDKDCKPVPDSDLEPTAAGWRYKPTGEIIPQGDTFVSRDRQGRHWRCQGTISWLNGRKTETTRCLFVAPGIT